MENISKKKNTTTFPQTTEGRTNVLKNLRWGNTVLTLKLNVLNMIESLKGQKYPSPDLHIVIKKWNGYEIRSTLLLYFFVSFSNLTVHNVQ